MPSVGSRGSRPGPAAKQSRRGAAASSASEGKLARPRTLSNASSRCALPSRPAASCRRVNSEPRSARRPLRGRPRPGRVRGPRGRPTALWRHAPGGPRLPRGCEGKARAGPPPASSPTALPSGGPPHNGSGPGPVAEGTGSRPSPLPRRRSPRRRVRDYSALIGRLQRRPRARPA